MPRAVAAEYMDMPYKAEFYDVYVYEPDASDSYPVWYASARTLGQLLRDLVVMRITQTTTGIVITLKGGEEWSCLFH